MIIAMMISAQNEPHPLLAEVEAYLVRTGVTATRLGAEATGERGLVALLRRGREPRRATARRVRQWMADHPNGLALHPSTDEAA